MTEVSFDTQQNVPPDLSVRIGQYNNLVLLYKLYSTQGVWGKPGSLGTIDAARNLVLQYLPGEKISKNVALSENGYDYQTRIASLMAYSLENTLPLIFSQDRVQKALKYTGPDCVQVEFQLASHYSSHKETPYWEITEDQRRPLKIGRLLIAANARKIKAALPQNIHDRMRDEDYLDLSAISQASHEFTHAIDETIEVDATAGHRDESTYKRSIRLNPDKFSVTQDTIWGEILHREHFARGVEMFVLEDYLKRNFGLTDAEYLQFHESYYRKDFNKGASFRFLMEYLRKQDEKFDFNELTLLKAHAKSRLRTVIPLPDVGLFLPYAEEPYSIDTIRQLAREEGLTA